MFRFGLPVQIDEVKAAGDAWEVSGYASTFGNIDLGGDIVQETAFDRTLADGHRVKFLRSHNIDNVLGVAKEMRSDKKGLFGTFKISKTQMGEETHQLLKDGAIDSFSIGYIARGWEWQRDEDEKATDVRLLKDVDLIEVSLVAVPMNPEARVTHVKGFLEGYSLAEQASLVRAGLAELIDDAARVAAKSHPLTESKRRELHDLLETFSGLDAVRSDLSKLLSRMPPGGSESLRLRLELMRRRAVARGILAP